MNVIGGVGTSSPSGGRVRRLRRRRVTGPQDASVRRQIGGLRVLVVDDDPVIQRLVAATLADEGYEVAVARDGLEAVRCALQSRPDAIILDLEMPGLDGRSAFRAMRARGVRAPVLLLSANGAHEARRELRAEAALEKPFDPEDLVSRLEGVLATGAGNGASAAGL